MGAGIQVGPNVMKAFDRLGILPQVEDIACTVPTCMPCRPACRALHAVPTVACHDSELLTHETRRTITDVRETGEGTRVDDEAGGALVGRALIAADGV